MIPFVNYLRTVRSFIHSFYTFLKSGAFIASGDFILQVATKIQMGVLGRKQNLTLKLSTVVGSFNCECIFSL